MTTATYQTITTTRAVFKLNQDKSTKLLFAANEELDPMEEILAGDALTVAAADLLAAAAKPPIAIVGAMNNETEEVDDPRDLHKTFAHGGECAKSN